MLADYKKRFIVSVALTVPALALSPLIQELVGIADRIRFTGDLYVLWGFSTAIFVYGGYPFLKGLVDDLRSRSPGMMTLIALAISVAYLYSSAVVFGLSGKVFFWELATLVDVMLLGHWLEMRSVMGASGAVEQLAKLLPSVAHKLAANGSTTDVAVSELEVGDKVLVKPGEQIPVDGIIIEGETSVDEAMVTGESQPVPKAADDEVIGGSVNGEGAVTVEIKKTGEESYVFQMVAMVREAQESKSKTQNLADRAARWLTFVAIGAGVVTIAVWLVLMNRDFAFSLERTVTVMVITCPHALGLAIPLVVAVSTALSAKNGLLIRDRTAFERARDIQAVLFDKTGTLTQGRFGVVEVVTLGEMKDRKSLLTYAASVESRSEHPIAKAIVSSVEKTREVSDFSPIRGKGAEGRVDGKDVKVVSWGYLEEKKVAVDPNKVSGLSSDGKTVVYVLIDDELSGAIALADVIRDESKRAISQLKKQGIRCMMITGDNDDVARWVADEVGLDEYFAGVLPQAKVHKVKEVQSRGLIVAMTGDGVNDAPALAQADVGIAIGAGTDIAAATADIILARSNPLDVVALIELSRATYRKMLQNLAWATGYNVFAIPLAAGALYAFGVLLSPAIGAILMSASTVIVAVNARFLKMRR